MGSGNSSSTKSNPSIQSPTPIVERVKSSESIKSNPQYSQEQTDDHLHLSQLKIPVYVSHVKSGNTLCSNDHVLLIQDGSTTIEFWLLPDFKPRKIPWRFGLVRDIVWCSQLNLFILLTKNALFTVNPQLLLIPDTSPNKPPVDFTISTYVKVKPYDDRALFWRCTCVGTTVYISYSGHGTIIDEYSLSTSSCTFVKRWTPPHTCSVYDGIWCIRYHPEIHQLGFTILDTRTNQWRMEIRRPDNFATIWQTVLPISNGDAEISPLTHGEWAIINSCGIRLLQISNNIFKAAVEYERELRNAIVFNDFYFVIRSKNTLEFHQYKQLKGKH